MTTPSHQQIQDRQRRLAVVEQVHAFALASSLIVLIGLLSLTATLGPKAATPPLMLNAQPWSEAMPWEVCAGDGASLPTATEDGVREAALDDRYDGHVDRDAPPPPPSDMSDSLYHGAVQVACPDSAREDAAADNSCEAECMWRASYSAQGDFRDNQRHNSYRGINASQPIEPTSTCRGLFLLAQPEVVTAFGQRPGMRVVLVNATDIPIAFSSCDGAIHLVQEALDENAQWRPIEFRRGSMCGNSYYRVMLAPNRFWAFPAPRYRGSMPTLLRFTLTSGGQRIRSNIFNGSVNPAQFDHPRDIAARLDTYADPLEWLRDHTNGEGVWVATGYDGEWEQARGSAVYNLSALAAAIHAFDDRGYYDANGRFPNALRIAIGQLRARQRADGACYAQDSPIRLQDQAAALWGFCNERYGRGPLVQKHARRALDHLLELIAAAADACRRNPDHTMRDEGVAFAMLALRAAASLALDVPDVESQLASLMDAIDHAPTQHVLHAVLSRAPLRPLQLTSLALRFPATGILESDLSAPTWLLLRETLRTWREGTYDQQLCETVLAAISPKGDAALAGSWAPRPIDADAGRVYATAMYAQLCSTPRYFRLGFEERGGRGFD